MFLLEDEACKVLLWLSTWFTLSAYYHILALAVDRVVAILAPFWHRSLNKRKVARAISATVTVAACLFTLPDIPLIVMSEATTSCGYDRARRTENHVLYQFVLLVYTPIGVLTVSNVVFIWALILRARKRRSTNQTDTTNRERENERSANERNYIAMLLAATCSFVVFQLLSVFSLRYARSLALQGVKDGRVELFRNLGRLASILKSSVNILFYSSNAMFRKALVKAVREIFTKK